MPREFGVTYNHGFVFEFNKSNTDLMSRDRFDTLFEQYETAYDKFDLDALSGYCADNFISAGPQGTIAYTMQEFEKKAKETLKFYQSVGRNSARIISKRVMPICDKYSMVVVRWGIIFDKTGDKPLEFDMSYIIQETGIVPKIILFISHEDEEAAIKKMGLQVKKVK